MAPIQNFQKIHKQISQDFKPAVIEENQELKISLHVNNIHSLILLRVYLNFSKFLNTYNDNYSFFKALFYFILIKCENIFISAKLIHSWLSPFQASIFNDFCNCQDDVNNIILYYFIYRQYLLNIFNKCATTSSRTIKTVKQVNKILNQHCKIVQIELVDCSNEMLQMLNISSSPVSKISQQASLSKKNLLLFFILLFILVSVLAAIILFFFQ